MKKRGGIFDFNRNGKVDFWEIGLAHKQYKKIYEKNEESVEDKYNEENEYLCEDSIPEDPYEQECLDGLNGSNQRMYEAASRLSDIKNGEVYFFSTNRQDEIEKCEFVLANNCIASRYFSISDGFMFEEAVKENFRLPEEILCKNAKSIEKFQDLFLEITEVDSKLAVEIWKWCAQEFLPYRTYMNSEWLLCGDIIDSTEKYPREFLDYAVEALGRDRVFREAVLTDSENFQWNTYSFVSHAIKRDLIDEAKNIFAATLGNPVGTSDDKAYYIKHTIDACSDAEELETIETFYQKIFPFVGEMDNRHVQRLLPEFEKKIKEQISYVESYAPKYRYSRKFAWRKTCPDGQEYGIDPVNFDTEEHYMERLARNKQIHEKRQNNEIMKQQAEKKKYVDLSASTDKTVYTFCGVIFSEKGCLYHYRTEDETLQIGDKVIVPVGRENKESVAEIVTIEKHRCITAPYPPEKTKFIKSRWDEPQD